MMIEDVNIICIKVFVVKVVFNIGFDCSVLGVDVLFVL